MTAEEDRVFRGRKKPHCPRMDKHVNGTVVSSAVGEQCESVCIEAF